MSVIGWFNPNDCRSFSEQAQEIISLLDAQNTVMASALDEIILAVCYACEEDIESKEEMLQLISAKARNALGRK